MVLMDMGAVVIGGVTAAIAVWGIFTQRAIAARKTTIEFLARSELDHDLIAARKKFITLSKLGGLVPYAAADKEQSDEVEAIRIVLNEFELVAIGIQRGILDYTTYQRWMKSAAIHFWNHALPFVTELRGRTNNPRLYSEFEVMVGWLKEGTAPRRNFWIGRLF